MKFSEMYDKWSGSADERFGKNDKIPKIPKKILGDALKVLKKLSADDKKDKKDDKKIDEMKVGNEVLSDKSFRFENCGAGFQLVIRDDKGHYPPDYEKQFDTLEADIHTYIPSNDKTWMKVEVENVKKQRVQDTKALADGLKDILEKADDAIAKLMTKNGYQYVSSKSALDPATLLIKKKKA